MSLPSHYEQKTSNYYQLHHHARHGIMGDLLTAHRRLVLGRAFFWQKTSSPLTVGGGGTWSSYMNEQCSVNVVVILWLVRWPGGWWAGFLHCAGADPNRARVGPCYPPQAVMPEVRREAGRWGPSFCMLLSLRNLQSFAFPMGAEYCNSYVNKCHAGPRLFGKMTLNAHAFDGYGAIFMAKPVTSGCCWIFRAFAGWPPS